jgi:hypothetical protein
MKLKYRKTLFMGLMATLAAGSLVLSSSFDGGLGANLAVTTVFQPFLVLAIYLICFGSNVTGARSPFE